MFGLGVKFSLQLWNMKDGEILPVPILSTRDASLVHQYTGSETEDAFTLPNPIDVIVV